MNPSLLAFVNLSRNQVQQVVKEKWENTFWKTFHFLELQWIMCLLLELGTLHFIYLSYKENKLLVKLLIPLREEGNRNAVYFQAINEIIEVEQIFWDI